MSQKFPSLAFADADIKAIDDALAVLEQKFAPLLALSPEERQVLAEMVGKSQELYQQALAVAAMNPGLIPEPLASPEDCHDFDDIDKLRSRVLRLRQLLEKIDDGQMALGV